MLSPENARRCLERYSSFLLLLSPPEPSFVANPPPLEATNSTRPVSLLSPSLSLLSPSLTPLSPPLYAHSGNAPGSQSSASTVVPYCASSTPAKASSLSVRAGFRRAGEDCSFALKWVPFSFRARNVVIFEVRGGGGEPGGEGGRSRFGWVGRVRLRRRARWEVWGEPGGAGAGSGEGEGSGRSGRPVA